MFLSFHFLLKCYFCLILPQNLFHCIRFYLRTSFSFFLSIFTSEPPSFYTILLQNLLLSVRFYLRTNFLLWDFTSEPPSLYSQMYCQISFSQLFLALLLFSHSVVSDFLWLHRLQHTGLPHPSLFLRACSNSCPLSQWCHPIISSSVNPFSSCLQSFATSSFFPVSWFFTIGGQSIGTSTSALVLPVNIQGWFPLRLTGLISLKFKGLSRVFSSTTVWKHQFLGAQPSFFLVFIYTLCIYFWLLWVFIAAVFSS